MIPRIGKLAIITLVALMALTGCSGKTKVESDLRIKGAPDWVNEGTRYLADKQGRLFHGVGSAPEMGDEAMQIYTADQRARAELAQILSSYLDVVSKDYTAAASAGGESAAEQSVTRQIESITKVNLTGAEIIGRWKDKRTANIHSIAELDMKHVKQTLDQVEAMNNGLGNYIDTQGDSIFDRLVGGQ